VNSANCVRSGVSEERRHLLSALAFVLKTLSKNLCASAPLFVRFVSFVVETPFPGPLCPPLRNSSRRETLEEMTERATKGMRVFANILFLFTVVMMGSVSAPVSLRAAEGAAVSAVSNSPAQRGPAQPRTTPVDAPTKKKVGFMAGAGLLILSLLALGTALALIRAFKR
jgi:hypothetical protein